MKEMNRPAKTILGGKSMKKIAIIAVLAMALTLVMGSVALAKNNVMMFDGTAEVGSDIVYSGTTVTVPPAYNNWAESAAPTYYRGSQDGWADVGFENLTANAGSTPHGGYTTSTIKCAVCHSVHSASTNAYDSDGDTVNDQTPDTLLKMAAEDACAFCHVTNPVQAKHVYGGSLAIWGGDGDDHHGGDCSRCHAGPHAANVEDADYAELYLLKDISPDRASYTSLTGMINSTAYGSGVATATYTDDTLSGDAEKWATVGLFCAGCHSGSYQNAVGNNTNDAAGVLTGHRVMASARTTYTAPTPTNGLSETTSTVSYDGIGAAAYAPATNCVSCHDADNGFGEGYGFPHFAPGAARFLNSAAHAGDAGAPVGVSATADDGTFGVVAGAVETSVTTEDVAQYSLKDGVCLKCHRDGTAGNAASDGVGIDF
jgi:mono/diheme cytochrome c family protein